MIEIRFRKERRDSADIAGEAWFRGGVPDGEVGAETLLH
jgi:hypothetical protein